jgi:transposase
MAARIILQVPRAVRRRLLKVVKKTKDAQLRTRCQIVLLYQKGWGSHQIEVALGCARATVSRVVNRFLNFGEDGLIDRRVDNGHPKVDADLLQALAELVAGTPEQHRWPRPTWTKQLLAITLSEQTQVSISVTTVSRMLDALKARWGMARPTVACPWSKGRKTRRVNRIRKVIERLPESEIAFYEDELDVHLNPRIGRDWMLRGQQKAILTPGKNKKRYVAGALASDGTDFVFVSSEYKNGLLFLSLLDKLRATHPEATKIHVILDNYAIHSSKPVVAYLRKHADVFVLHFLPPYCPQHNKIERFWREVHANVTRNHRCRTMGQLMDKLRAFLYREQRRRRRSAKTQTRVLCNIVRAA